MCTGTNKMHKSYWFFYTVYLAKVLSVFQQIMMSQTNHTAILCIYNDDTDDKFQTISQISNKLLQFPS
jgi:hypothetical protein